MELCLSGSQSWHSLHRRAGQVLAMAALSDTWGQAIGPQIQDSSGFFGGDSPPESSSDKV